MSARPASGPAAAPAADEWVNETLANKPRPAAPVQGSVSRLTIDLDTEVHKTFKALCARNGLRMADEVRRCIEQRIAELDK